MSVQPNQSLRDLNLFITPASAKASLRQRAALTLALWRQRTRTRRFLAQIDARSLAEAGISRAAAAYESGKPFWRPMGTLR
jgi:uncharacterized protein YjiS (DUF1127 family)